MNSEDTFYAKFQALNEGSVFVKYVSELNLGFTYFISCLALLGVRVFWKQDWTCKVEETHKAQISLSLLKIRILQKMRLSNK